MAAVAAKPLATYVAFLHFCSCCCSGVCGCVPLTVGADDPLPPLPVPPPPPPPRPHGFARTYWHGAGRPPVADFGATYWANGALETLNDSAGYSLSFGVDGEGRPYSSTDGSGGHPLASTLYNSASLPTQLSFGYTGDSDYYAYDQNTNRMTQYKFTVNGQSLTGNLTWNSNGTLGCPRPHGGAEPQRGADRPRFDRLEPGLFYSARAAGSASPGRRNCRAFPRCVTWCGTFTITIRESRAIADKISENVPSVPVSTRGKEPTASSNHLISPSAHPGQRGQL